MANCGGQRLEPALSGSPNADVWRALDIARRHLVRFWPGEQSVFCGQGRWSETLERDSETPTARVRPSLSLARARHSEAGGSIESTDHEMRICIISDVIASLAVLCVAWWLAAAGTFPPTKSVAREDNNDQTHPRSAFTMTHPHSA